MIIKNNKEDFEVYLSDASNFKGDATMVYIPETVNELKNIVKGVYSNNVEFTISAARTGLTASAVPLNSVLISVERLNKIISIDKQSKTVVLEPGVVINDLQSELEKYQLFYPPNPTEQNSTIGGNVATNASGAKTFKYGSTRNYVLSLKILLPDGDEIDITRGKYITKDNNISIPTRNGKTLNIPIHGISMPNIKHAAGYYLRNDVDLIDIIIGSEGTLGIVYEIEISVLSLPNNVLGGLIFFSEDKQLIEFVNYLRSKSLSESTVEKSEFEMISSRLIEYFDDRSLNLLRNKYPQIPQNAQGAIWIEQEYEIEDEEILVEQWYKFIGEYTNFIDDTWFAIDDRSHENLSQFRHSLPLSVFEIISQKDSFKIGTDTAVPSLHLSEYYNFLKYTLVNSGLTYFTWGHIGNSHFHVNMITNNDNEVKLAKEIYNKIIDKALEMGGTVSAEHGIGKLKREYLYRMFGKDIIDYMKSIKEILDPKLLLNRNNLFYYE